MFYRSKSIVFCLLLIIFFTSCRYSNYQATSYPKEKYYANHKINLALVLSGAGSKGIAHAGVIAAFEKYNIPIDLIVGSSAGALVGLLYSDSKNIEKVKQTLIKANRNDFLQGSPVMNFFGATIFNNPAGFNEFDKFLTKHVIAKKYEELSVPLAVVATDISSNNSKIFNSGIIKDSIFASCAIPGLYKPVRINNGLFVDGGVIAPVPVKEALKFKPTITVAVNIVSPPPQEEITNNLSILYKSSWITYYNLSSEQENHADFSINIDTSKYDWLDDLKEKDKIELFELGYKAGESLIKNKLL